MMLPFLPAGSRRLAIATNTLSQFVGRVISSAAIFFASIFIARAFGTNGYGDFVKITGFVALFYLFSDFGLNAVYLQKKDTYPWQILFGLRFIVSIILVFIALGVLSFLPRGTTQGYTDGVRLGIILFAPAIVLQAVITTANALFQEKLRYDLSTVAITIGSLMTLFLVWIVSLASSPLVGPVVSSIAFLIGTGVTAITSLILIKRYTHVAIQFDRVKMRELFLASVPLGLTLLFNQIYFHADIFILTLTRSTNEVGIYGFAYKVFEVALVIPTFFMNSIYPMMLKGASEPAIGFVRLVKKSFILLFVGSLFSTGVLWTLSPFFVLIRPEFVQSIMPLRILSLSLPFFFLSSLCMWTIITMGRQKLLVPIYCLAMVINILFNIWLVPTYGYVAAAWTTVASEALVLLVTGAIAFRLIHQKKTT